ncbi:DNA repair protein RadC [Lactobacillus kalixensis DSM 16043]|uniref:DNA repair protein RadC n=2 Tax=Lactobacillus kalixensis TaxID=227944 RepID=A0A0R1UD62_9LACO|nr:DNA repair protein RadC [Lactobacillus kalixensis DSM 16043]
MINTDTELLGRVFSQLEGKGYCNLKDIEARINDLKISSFTDLINYISGPECNGDLAVALEEMLDRLRLTEPKREEILTSSREVGQYLSNKLVGHKQEEFWVLYIDNGNHIVAEKRISQGTLDRSFVHPRDVFRWGVLFNCSAMIAVHNHPSGRLWPSESDFQITKNLQENAKMMKINFLDHFIVGKGKYLSMKEEEIF